MVRTRVYSPRYQVEHYYPKSRLKTKDDWIKYVPDTYRWSDVVKSLTGRKGSALMKASDRSDVESHGERTCFAPKIHLQPSCHNTGDKRDHVAGCSANCERGEQSGISAGEDLAGWVGRSLILAREADLFRQGYEISQGTEEFKALLGTAHGNGIAHLVADNAEVLKDKVVESANVFATRNGNYHLLYTLSG